MECIVCGLGESTRTLTAPAEYYTLGVNDILRFGWHPDHHVVLDEPGKFKSERRRLIQATRAKVTTWWFMPWPGWTEPPALPDMRKVRLRDFVRQGLPIRMGQGDDELPHHEVSPFAAASIAYRLGFRRIGVLGVDLLPGRHHLWPLAHSIGLGFAKLREAMIEQGGVELVNCSRQSAALKDHLPYVPLEEIARR